MKTFFARWVIEFQRPNNKLYHKIIITETKQSIGEAQFFARWASVFQGTRHKLYPKIIITETKQSIVNCREKNQQLF